MIKRSGEGFRGHSVRRRVAADGAPSRHHHRDHRVKSWLFLLELHGGDTFITRWSVIPSDIVAGQHWITILTSMFMHEGWMHIIGNMVFLWAFGPQIEDAMGPFPLPGVLFVWWPRGFDRAGRGNVRSTIPNLGASGAIAAVMGAFLITYPRDQIRTLIAVRVFALR